MVAILGFSQSSLFPLGIDREAPTNSLNFSMIFYGAKKRVPHSEIEVDVAFSSSFNETSLTQKWH